MIKHSCFLLLFFLSPLYGLQLPRSVTGATLTPAAPVTRATLQRTSATSVATTTSAQTKALNAEIFSHGQMFVQSTRAFTTIHKHDIQWLDYNGLPEIITALTPAFPLFLDAQGHYNHLSFWGATPRDVQVFFNGRTMAHGTLGMYLPEEFSTEMMEKAEIFVGSDAAILADNAAGALINLQEIRHNTRRPFSRIWYHQGGGDFGASDGTFSYNIAPNWNMTLGYRSASNAGTYQNSASDLFSLRAQLRWNFSSLATVSLSYIYTSHIQGLNGGLDSLKQAGDIGQFTLTTLFGALREDQRRHDITLSSTLFFDRKRSTGSATGSVYATVLSLERALVASGTTFLNPQPDSIRGVLSTQATIARGVSVGASGRLETMVNISSVFMGLTLGGNIDLHHTGDFSYFPDGAGATELHLGAFARGEIDVSGTAVLSGGWRLAILNSRVHTALGGKLSIFFDKRRNEGNSFFGDLSFSYRAPSFIEGGSELKSENHLLALAGLKIREEPLFLELTGFYRRVIDPIVSKPITYSRTTNSIQVVSTESYNGGERTTSGITVRTGTRFRGFLGGNLLLSGFAQLSLSTTSDTNNRRFPLVYAGLEAQYEYKVGRSILRAGLRLKALSPFRGERFIPTAWSYVDSDYEQKFVTNGLDIIAGAEVGNAYIRVTYQNALNTLYYLVPLYPHYGTNLRLSLSWAFLD